MGAWLSKMSWANYNVVPDISSLFPDGGLLGIFTGRQILACVSLAKADRKVRTKLLCLRDFSGPVLTSSELCFA